MKVLGVSCLAVMMLCVIVQADASFTPVFTGCPDIIKGSYCDSLYFQVVAVSPKSGRSGPVRYHLVSGPGTIDEKTGFWVWYPTKENIGKHDVEISASIDHRSTSGDDNCHIPISVLDQYPRFIEGCEKTYILTEPSVFSAMVKAEDPDPCDSVTYELVDVIPKPVGKVMVDARTGRVIFNPDTLDGGKTFEVQVSLVVPGRRRPLCRVFFQTDWETGLELYTLRIETERGPGSNGVIQGEYADVDILLESIDPSRGLGGFDLVVRYPDSALQFTEAMQGDIYTECGWEYFTYRTTFPSGLVKLVGLAETNDGANHPGCADSTPYVGQLPTSLAAMRFRVASDMTYECDFLPIQFYWANCSDNTLASSDGRISLVSHAVYDFDSTLIPPVDNGPNFGGIPQDCFDNSFGLVPAIDFYNGGVEVKCNEGNSAVSLRIGIDNGPDGFGLELGSPATVDVILDELSDPLGGFDLMFAYDTAALRFLEALPGHGLYDDCDWEYFTFQTGSAIICEGDCPGGLVRLIGLADLNNGADNLPSCRKPNSLPAVIAELRFQTTDDQNWECQFSPVRFFWTSCADNTMADSLGTTLYMADRVRDFDGHLLPEPTDLPTYLGPPLSCDVDIDPPPARVMQLMNGGVEFKCLDSISDNGDLNLNGIAYEIADLITYYNYFLKGLSAFVVNVEAQTQASDINQDGTPLTPEDLVILARIVIGDALPGTYLAPSPNPARFYFNGANTTLYLDTPDELGFVFFEFAGDVKPLLSAYGDVDMNYEFDGTNTRVFISKDYLSSPSDPIVHGELLYFPNPVELLTAMAATVDGRAANASVDMLSDVDDNSSGLPDEFSVSQNYPNPFNPETVIGFGLPRASHVEIEVYNVAGQKVATLFNGYKTAGYHEVRWGGRDESGSTVASGVYFYRITAGDFIETRKMLLLK